MSIFARTRINRKSQWVRDLMAETSINVSDLILPIFVVEGEGIVEPIKSLPGVYRYSIDKLIEKLREVILDGISSIMLFPCVDSKFKSFDGIEAVNPDNLICRTIKTIKDKQIDIGIICDVALDPYTTHGHDGVVVGEQIDNDLTVEILVKQALVQARAGCDFVAPSDMMDGKVSSIRAALENEGYSQCGIIAYSAKYCSKLYGPFREAVRSLTKAPIDKSSYQMDVRNSKEAMRQINIHAGEGADMVIVKPGLCYLDVIKLASETINIPVIGYQVSGEYAMIKFAALNNCFSFIDVLIETMIAYKRAGASGIITYGAHDVAKYLKSEKTGI